MITAKTSSLKHDWQICNGIPTILKPWWNTTIYTICSTVVCIHCYSNHLVSPNITISVPTRAQAERLLAQGYSPHGLTSVMWLVPVEEIDTSKYYISVSYLPACFYLLNIFTEMKGLWLFNLQTLSCLKKQALIQKTGFF